MGKKVVRLYEVVLIICTYFLLYNFLGNKLAEIVLKSDHTRENLIFVQMLVDIFILLLIVFLSMRIIVHSVKKKIDVDFFWSIGKYYLHILIANFICAVPIAFISSSETSNNQEILKEFTQEYKFYMFFMTIIFAPIVEELVFRGAIYKFIRQIFGKNLSIILTSVGFAGVHFIGSLITKDYQDLIFLPLYLIPSIYLCAIYEKTKNIFAPILLHAINNYMSFMLTVL